MKHRIFVYGTLKEERPDDYELLDYALGTVADRPFPGIVPDAGSRVIGQVIEVGDDALQRLDAYEGTEIGLYRRVRVHVNHRETGRMEPVWVYEFTMTYIVPLYLFGVEQWIYTPEPNMQFNPDHRGIIDVRTSRIL